MAAVIPSKEFLQSRILEMLPKYLANIMKIILTKYFLMNCFTLLSKNYKITLQHWYHGEFALVILEKTFSKLSTCRN